MKEFLKKYGSGLPLSNNTVRLALVAYGNNGIVNNEATIQFASSINDWSTMVDKTLNMPTGPDMVYAPLGMVLSQLKYNDTIAYRSFTDALIIIITDH